MHCPGCSAAAQPPSLVSCEARPQPSTRRDPSFRGDGGQGAQAQLYETNVAIVGPDGAVYMALANNLISKVEPNTR